MHTNGSRLPSIGTWIEGGGERKRVCTPKRQLCHMWQNWKLAAMSMSNLHNCRGTANIQWRIDLPQVKRTVQWVTLFWQSFCTYLAWQNIAFHHSSFYYHSIFFDAFCFILPSNCWFTLQPRFVPRPIWQRSGLSLISWELMNVLWSPSGSILVNKIPCRALLIWIKKIQRIVTMNSSSILGLEVWQRTGPKTTNFPSRNRAWK